jgi:hypothetical protein
MWQRTAGSGLQKLGWARLKLRLELRLVKMLMGSRIFYFFPPRLELPSYKSRVE